MNTIVVAAAMRHAMRSPLNQAGGGHDMRTAPACKGAFGALVAGPLRNGPDVAACDMPAAKACLAASDDHERA